MPVTDVKKYDINRRIYLPKWGGVRIEDDVIINKDGCEILNKTTKDLVVLD